MADLNQPPDDDLDTDSTLGSEPPSTTASLSSSILNYQYENGRRYHAYKAGKYPIPNDEREQDRLDFTHHIFSMLLKGELYTAPLESAPKRVLDVGTGTGIWVSPIRLIGHHHRAFSREQACMSGKLVENTLYTKMSFSPSYTIVLK